MNDQHDQPTRIKAMIRRLYDLKAELQEALWQPDSEYYEWLSECFDNLCQEIRDAGGTVPDALI
jgi:hypothetical protein